MALIQRQVPSGRYLQGVTAMEFLESLGWGLVYSAALSATTLDEARDDSNWQLGASVVRALSRIDGADPYSSQFNLLALLVVQSGYATITDLDMSWFQQTDSSASGNQQVLPVAFLGDREDAAEGNILLRLISSLGAALTGRAQLASSFTFPLNWPTAMASSADMLSVSMEKDEREAVLSSIGDITDVLDWMRFFNSGGGALYVVMMAMNAIDPGARDQLIDGVVTFFDEDLPLNERLAGLADAMAGVAEDYSAFDLEPLNLDDRDWNDLVTMLTRPDEDDHGDEGVQPLVNLLNPLWHLPFNDYRRVTPGNSYSSTEEEEWVRRYSPAWQLAFTVELASHLVGGALAMENALFGLSPVTVHDGGIPGAVRHALNWRLADLVRKGSLCTLFRGIWRQTVTDAILGTFAYHGLDVSCFYDVFCWMNTSGKRSRIDAVFGSIDYYDWDTWQEAPESSELEDGTLRVSVRVPSLEFSLFNFSSTTFTDILQDWSDRGAALGKLLLKIVETGDLTKALKSVGTCELAEIQRWLKDVEDSTSCMEELRDRVNGSSSSSGGGGGGGGGGTGRPGPRIPDQPIPEFEENPEHEGERYPNDDPLWF